ncbi:addiction module protein [Turneriella parva]|uniref:Addiction module component, TIGR02574 family n=1 Tax=Turneriella parva (strain ATCC BAA-1111 / DSM 21527 / NCTC 11395 / H) TaxID=869212 RepID=I4BA14_TURPD|nr:addiction module protein [Turneriella parva]AFM14121.1 addiction module component, TIGR02574 family [Turneriella parva DSM 21527]
MSVTELVAEIRQMKSAEKLDLLETLWENIAQEYDQTDIPQRHQDEIHSRFDKYTKDKTSAVSWDKAKESILKRYEDRDYPRSSR